MLGKNYQNNSSKSSSRVQFLLQEFEKFGKFATSLLNRASKLTDLVQSLESELSYIKEKGDDHPEVKRADKLGAQKTISYTNIEVKAVDSFPPVPSGVTSYSHPPTGLGQSRAWMIASRS